MVEAPRAILHNRFNVSLMAKDALFNVAQIAM